VRDVGGSYRRALADTVEHFTAGAHRPRRQILTEVRRRLNNDWEASGVNLPLLEAQGQMRSQIQVNYETLVTFFQSTAGQIPKIDRLYLQRTLAVTT